MILVTGAGGKTGRAVIRALLGRQRPVRERPVRERRLRALVHRETQRSELESMGVADVTVGDLRSAEDVRRALREVHAVYLICPNMCPDEEEMAATMIAEGRTSGLQHLVYHSVLHPQIEAMPHHGWKLRVEERLCEAGLPFTVLQPAAYMQNLLASCNALTEGGIYSIPYAASTRLSWVDLADVAEVAAKVLTETGHHGATYQLVGTEGSSQTEVAAVLSHGLSKRISLETLSPAAWEQRARAAGLQDDLAIRTLMSMFAYYEQHGFCGNPGVLTWLLGRRPTTLQGFIERVLAP